MDSNEVYRQQRNAGLEYERRVHLAGREAWLRGSRPMTWWQRLFTKGGVVEKIDLTFGGAGNQVMTISGVQYATWIDHRQWPRIGSRVRHKPYEEFDGRGGKLLATRILEGEANDRA